MQLSMNIPIRLKHFGLILVQDLAPQWLNLTLVEFTKCCESRSSGHYESNGVTHLFLQEELSLYIHVFIHKLYS